MTELTPQEIEQISREAEEKYPVDMKHYSTGEHKGMMAMCDSNYYEREAYAAALTSERLRHKAEIQVYREFLEYIIDVRKDESVSKEMFAVFAENVIVKYQNHQP